MSQVAKMKKMSLMKKLKRSGPSIKPCDTINILPGTEFIIDIRFFASFEYKSRKFLRKFV